jgi:hypothetical protein
MSITRPFELTDILRFNQVNADSWTATVRSPTLPEGDNY